MITQILINSIISGLLLSLVAIGFNLIFNTTRVFHLAHGAIYVTAVYAVYTFSNFFNQFLTPAVSVILSIFLSFVLITGIIFIVEYSIYRPLYVKNVDPTISMISSLGVYLLVVNVIAFFFGSESISLNNSSKTIVSTAYFKLTDIELTSLIASSVVLLAILLFSRTKYYMRIRAITDSYIVAEKFGINVQRTRLLALIIGTILAGIAGMIKGYEIAIDPHVGLTITLAAAVAVIVGGVKSLHGTIMACLLIALIENFSVKFLSAQWTNALTYTLLIAVLIFYRQGLISVRQRIETT
jgi:branched-chain amino acid transport system permease protein